MKAIKKWKFKIGLHKVLILTIMTLFSVVAHLIAQDRASLNTVYVDQNGVMRWESKEEVKGFGVNYSVPFAHAYRSAIRMGIDPKEAIDNDVYHFTRLGFDLYRLHVWDTEISDVEGNLIENAQLDTFDYLLKKLKDHNINFVITPIAFWGNGWPEPDTKTPGFSHKYGKGECLTNEHAIKAQQNYLFQFLNHVNPYTGVAYKDEPNVIAFEVSNEPHHRGEAKAVTEFVKGMVESMRSTGTKKPIFYNMSHAVHFADAYFKGNVQGGTFQWYPTGLGYQKELAGNMLPNADDYKITFNETIKSYEGAKMVYEFDAADIGRSYIYPAMARSFRTAGIQIATHFAYDPTYLAYANTEYNTHYMNLAYTPQKALSLKICSEIFHEIPLYSQFGAFPNNTTFDDFKVSYEDDLAEYNSDEKFFYTNSTNSIPKNENSLNEIAGFGNSEVVEYDGTGAYFLDKIEDGLWRLEVMPDAIWVDNPFGRNSPEKTVGVINWATHTMSVKLKNLGDHFKIKALNKGNNFEPENNNSAFLIKPGTYMLSKKGNPEKWSVNDPFKTGKLSDFYAPEASITKPWFKHKSYLEVGDNSDLTLKVQFVAPTQPIHIQLIGYNGLENIKMDMTKTGAYMYSATLAADKMRTGYFNYQVVVQMNNDKYITYPADKEGKPFDWDFYDRRTYQTRVVPKTFPIHLFRAKEDTDKLVRQWRRSFRLVPTQNENEAEYQMNIENLFKPDNENLKAEPIYDYSFKHFIMDKIEGRKEDLLSKEHFVFHGRALNNKSCKLQVAFVMDDGSSHGAVLEIGSATKDYRLSIKDLKPVKTVTLPRPYPTFLHYYFEHDLHSEFDLNRVESIQFSIGPDLTPEELKDSHGIGIISFRLE